MLLGELGLTRKLLLPPEPQQNQRVLTASPILAALSTATSGVDKERGGGIMSGIRSESGEASRDGEVSAPRWVGVGGGECGEGEDGGEGGGGGMDG